MAGKYDLFGISKLEIGDPGDGVMGVTLTEFNNIKEGTGTLTLPESTTTKIFTETNRNAPYRVIDEGSGEAPMMEFELFGIALEDWNKFLGGTYDAPTDKWSFPKTSQPIYVSMRVTTKETNANGDYIVIEIPYGLMTSGVNGPLTFNDLASIKGKIEAMVATAADGTEGDVLTVQSVAGA